MQRRCDAIFHKQAQPDPVAGRFVAVQLLWGREASLVTPPHLHVH